MHFIVSLLKIKVIFSDFYQFEKNCQFLNFTHCLNYSHYILPILHNIMVSIIYFCNWRISGKQNAIILESTPVRQPNDCIIHPPPQITHCLRHFSLIKKTHWMRYRQALVRHDWNPSLLIPEVNLTAVPETEKSILLN